MKKAMKKKTKGKKFPDMSGDGKVTKKDILVKRGVLKKQGDKFLTKFAADKLAKVIKDL